MSWWIDPDLALSFLFTACYIRVVYTHDPKISNLLLVWPMRVNYAVDDLCFAYTRICQYTIPSGIFGEQYNTVFIKFETKVIESLGLQCRSSDSKSWSSAVAKHWVWPLRVQAQKLTARASLTLVISTHKMISIQSTGDQAIMRLQLSANALQAAETQTHRLILCNCMIWKKSRKCTKLSVCLKFCLPAVWWSADRTRRTPNFIRTP